MYLDDKNDKIPTTVGHCYVQNDNRPFEYFLLLLKTFLDTHSRQARSIADRFTA